MFICVIEIQSGLLLECKCMTWCMQTSPTADDWRILIMLICKVVGTHRRQCQGSHHTSSSKEWGYSYKENPAFFHRSTNNNHLLSLKETQRLIQLVNVLFDCCQAQLSLISALTKAEMSFMLQNLHKVFFPILFINTIEQDTQLKSYTFIITEHPNLRIWINCLIH